LFLFSLLVDLKKFGSSHATLLFSSKGELAFGHRLVKIYLGWSKLRQRPSKLNEDLETLAVSHLIEGLFKVFITADRYHIVLVICIGEFQARGRVSYLQQLIEPLLN
jgi:hypothetical protein